MSSPEGTSNVLLLQMSGMNWRGNSGSGGMFLMPWEPWMGSMKPYGRRMLTREERIANYRISRGRRVVENAFGILVSRFSVMRTTIELPPETVREVVFTCVVLHNILRSQYQGQHGGQEPVEDDDDDVPGDCGLIGGAAGGGQNRNPAREAKRQRDYLKDYFNNEGAVAWQDGRIKVLL